MSAQGEDRFKVLADIAVPEPDAAAAEAAVAASRAAFLRERARAKPQVPARRRSFTGWWLLPAGGLVAAGLALAVVVPLWMDPGPDQPIEIATSEPVVILPQLSDQPVQLGARPPDATSLSREPPPIENLEIVTVGDVRLGYATRPSAIALYLVEDAEAVGIDLIPAYPGVSVVLLDAFRFQYGQDLSQGLAIRWQEVIGEAEPEPLWFVYIEDPSGFRRDLDLTAAALDAPDRETALARIAAYGETGQ